MKEEIERMYYEEKVPLRQIVQKLPHARETIKKHLSKGLRTKQEALRLRSTDEYREKLREKQLGELNHRAKLTAEKVISIRREYEELQLDGYGKTQAQYKLASDYNVSRSAISDVIHRRSWDHV